MLEFPDIVITAVPSQQSQKEWRVSGYATLGWFRVDWIGHGPTAEGPWHLELSNHPSRDTDNALPQEILVESNPKQFHRLVTDAIRWAEEEDIFMID